VRRAAPGRLAVVGLAARLPGAAGLDALWGRLCEGRVPAAPLPPDRFDAEALAPELPPGPPAALRAALLDDVPLDWRTLRLPPLQVQKLHLAEKLALQTMADAIADAGIRPGAAPLERAQIWIAATTLGPDPRIEPMRRIRRYRLAAPISEALGRVAPAARDGALAILDRLVDLASPPIEPDALFTSASIVAGRATNLYDFRGGHAAVDAGMASSLAAVEQAARALDRGECDLAVVCGVAPLVTPSVVLAHLHRGELAAGEPRPFDPAAGGTVLGEGAAAVVLRRAEDAGGARVYAVLESIAGAAEPGGEGPAALARCVARAAGEALAAAGTPADAVAAVASRAAGFASDAGEAAGLAEAYGARSAPLPVGSCVPASGFLQGATGMVALVGAALAVSRGEWPGSAGAVAPAPGLAPAEPGRLPAGARVAVSDGGPDPVAYHALLSAPGPARPAEAAPPPARRRARGEGFAVVGVGLVVPGANDAATYWRNVEDGVDPIGDLPRSRFDIEALVGRNAELANAFRTRLAATVSPPPFDPGRYGLPEAEREGLDPAVPIALLASEQALADAGWAAARAGGARGQAIFGQLSLRAREAAVETRVAFARTLALAAEALREAGLGDAAVREVLAEARAAFDARGAARWTEALEATTGLALTARVAASFGLGGVPLTLDAACASSLAAIRAACDALARGSADLVLAGGVAHNLLPEYYVGLGLLGALSPLGGLPFHADAEGFVPAEGAAAIALKRLDDARAAGDRIYAVVRGHGVSSDGRGLSIYSPSSPGQQLAIRRALEEAGIAPGAVDLVEAHGPGTHLGDRTEVASYAAVYGEAPRPAPLVLSASKSQVGHTTSAAGLVAVVRAALALDRRILPPTNLDGPLDPELGLERIPAVLPGEARPWPAPRGGPRRAAVSAFGMAGANHHLVLEEAPPAAAAAGAGPAPLVTLPGAALEADRFVLELAPVALPLRPTHERLAGRRALLAGGDEPFAAELSAALAARGLEVRRVPAGGDGSAEADLFVDLGASGAERGLLDAAAPGIAARAREAAVDAIRFARAAHPRLAADGGDRAAWVAVTSMGGDLGLSGSGAGNVLGAFQHGLALALKQELPAAAVKALDFAPRAPAAEVAEVLVRELEDGNERVQVGWAGRRFVASPRRAPHDPSAPALRRVGAGDVVLFSGGGRGVVFECALAVARLGAVAVVTGRTPPAAPDAPHAALDDEGFAALRRAELARRRGEPGLTPARFERDMERLARERELGRNLARARDEGLALEYEVCDVADAAAVEALVARVRARHGKIDVLAHGAMVERSASLPGKRDEDVTRTVDAKVAGLLHLLDATAAETLRAVVAFGSGVARFGNKGQTDYAGANALVAALLPAWLARRGSRAHAVTLDWPAWREVGWAAANPQTAAGLDAMGVTSISPEEGRFWFLAELAHGTAQEAVLVSERMLHAWPFFGARADGARPLPPFDDRAGLLVAGAFPLVDEVRSGADGRIVASRTLHAERDPFLRQHRVDDRPVLPGAFALELLCEAAALARPGARVAEVCDLEIRAPVALPRASAEVRAEVAPGAEGWLEARLTSRLAAGAGERIHATARIRLGPAASAEPVALPAAAGRVRARSFYRLSRDPVALGPLFCRVRWLELAGAEATATIVAPDPRRVVAGTGWPVFQVDPLLLDSAFQVAGSREGYGEGFVCVPVGLARLRVGRPLGPGERARARATCVGAEPPRVRYDVVVAGEDGALLLAVEGLVLHRVAAAAA